MPETDLTISGNNHENCANCGHQKLVGVPCKCKKKRERIPKHSGQSKSEFKFNEYK